MASVLGTRRDAWLDNLRAMYTRRAGAWCTPDQIEQIARMVCSCMEISPHIIPELRDDVLSLLCSTPVNTLSSISLEFCRAWGSFPDMRYDPDRYALTLRLIHARFCWACWSGSSSVPHPYGGHST